jgi:hypothetical protein
MGGLKWASSPLVHVPSLPELFNLLCLCHCLVLAVLLLLLMLISLSALGADVEHDGQAWQDLAVLVDIRLISTRRHAEAPSCHPGIVVYCRPGQYA